MSISIILRWSAEDLARESALGLNTIKRAELAEDETSLTQANDMAVRRALEAAGATFQNDGVPAAPADVARQLSALYVAGAL